MRSLVRKAPASAPTSRKTLLSWRRARQQGIFALALLLVAGAGGAGAGTGGQGAAVAAARRCCRRELCSGQGLDSCWLLRLRGGTPTTATTAQTQAGAGLQQGGSGAPGACRVMRLSGRGTGPVVRGGVSCSLLRLRGGITAYAKEIHKAARAGDAARVTPHLQALSQSPPWSRVEGKSQVNLPHMPPLRGGICMGVDSINHPFAPGLPPGRSMWAH